MVREFLAFQHRTRAHFFWLFLPLLFLIFLPSFITNSHQKDIAIYSCLTWVLLSGTFALSESAAQLYKASVLTLMILVLSAVSLPIPKEWLFLLRMFSLMLFFGWLLAFVFKRMATSKRISKNVIYAAVDGYLLLGILGGFGFRILHFFYPKAFAMPTFLESKLDVFTYFSFVTLTGVGYGDITPQSPPSQAMALFLAISGQLYLAVVIGILIGKYLMLEQAQNQ